MKKTGITIAIIVAIMICFPWGADRKTEKLSTPAESKNEETEQVADQLEIPPFVGALLDSSKWELPRTISQVNQQTYRYAHDFHNRTSIIYNDERILVEDPTLFTYTVSNDEKYQMLVGVAGKCLMIDTRDSICIAKLATLSNLLPEFRRFKKDYFINSVYSVLYHFSVDFPDASIPHAHEINSWIVKKVCQAANERRENQRKEYRYKGKKNDMEALGQFAANCYFDYIRWEYADFEELPNFHHLNLNLRARLLTKGFVTYQKATHNHLGGAHGYFTEELISYDFINKREIDWEYLFKPANDKDIEKLFIDVVCKDPKFTLIENAENRDEVVRKFSLIDKNDNPTGELVFPQPGLTDDGIVFSYQPYDISCFAAGAFHFTIPYEKVKPFLTERGRRCVELIQNMNL